MTDAILYHGEPNGPSLSVLAALALPGLLAVPAAADSAPSCGCWCREEREDEAS